MLPQFLVIGAMKAGSTTIYEDLRAHPQIFLIEKELDSFNSPSISTPTGRARYEQLFAKAAPGQLRGDVSATYAKLPETEGLAERAATVLGSDFQVVYSVRNPVDRVVSQHHHEYMRGKISQASIDDAVREVPRLISYSKYAYQLRPFVDAVGPENVHLIRFEDYTADRATGLGRLLDFLGVDRIVDGADLDRAHNVSEGLHIGTGRIWQLTRSAAYRRALRPLMPERVRKLGRRALLPTAPPRPAPPSPATVDRIIDAVASDLDALRSSSVAVPELWDLEATRQRYLTIAARSDGQVLPRSD